MTEPVTPPEDPVGTVHRLDQHRAARVALVKPTPPPDDRTPLEGVVVPAGQPPAVIRTARSVRRAITHERTRTAARVAARHGSYVLGGAGIVLKRAWHGRTVAVHHQMRQAAIAAGDHAGAAEWQDRADRFRQARHQRRMDLLTKVPHMVKSAAIGAAGVEGALLALGICMALSDHQAHDVIEPTMAVVHFIRTVCWLVSIVWGPFLAALPWAVLVGLWAVGKARGTAPTWALPAGQRADDGAPITPSIVVKALHDLGIAQLRKAIKEMGDAGAGMLGPITIAGCGVEVDVTLPSGVSTDEVQNRRRKLAENLSRHEHEVFITIPQAARTVRLWIADSGALDEPIGPSPLVTDPDATANYKTGRAPWGQDLRGEAALISLYQRHLLITGLSNQGKTASLRALALWLAFDPSVEFRIGDLKGIGDWRMFDGLATVLIEGPTDEHVIDVTEMVEGGVAEMERRLMAPAGTTFRPLILIVDEAQVAFMCPAKGTDGRPYGGTKATSRYFQAARKIHNQGRAVDVLLWQGTQDPTNENLPKLVREGAHIRASLVLGTEEQARMALGDKAIDGGAAPHKLRQGLDRGTVVVAGDGVKLAPGQSSTTIRTHYITDDQAKELANRAKARRQGVTTLTAVETGEQVDPLDDIAAVLGDSPRMRTQEVLQKLAERNPGTYREWTFGDLRGVLDAAGAPPRKSDGVMVVDRRRVLNALQERAEDTAASNSE